MTMTEKPTLETPLVQVVPTFEAFYRNEYRKVVGLAYALSGGRLMPRRSWLYMSS